MPILKIKQNGQWESIGAVTNAYTLEGKPASYFASAADVVIIQSDYLTSADMAVLQDDAAQTSEKVATNTSAIEALNDEVDDLVGEVDTISLRVGEVNTNLSDYKTEVSEQFAAVNETVSKHISNVENPHGVNKEQVGLDKVDNTSDLEKPISNAMQVALDDKADFEHDHAVDHINGLGDTLNDLQEGIDNCVEALGGKADFEHGHTIEDVDNLESILNDLQEEIGDHVANQGNPHVVTAEQVGAYSKEEVDDKVASLNILACVDDEGVLYFQLANSST